MGSSGVDPLWLEKLKKIKEIKIEGSDKTLSPEFLEILADQTGADVYEKSLYKFVEKAWPYIDPSPFVGGKAIQAVCTHLEAVKNGHIKRLIINIPPRCAKSSTTSVSFPAWVWAQQQKTPTSGPGVTFLHASYAQQLALRDSVKCRRLIESPFYQSLWSSRFQLMGDQNTKSRFDNSARGSRLSTSVGSALTGEGGDIIVVDDPNAAQEAFSEATIECTIEWWIARYRPGSTIQRRARLWSFSNGSQSRISPDIFWKRT